MSPLRQFNFLSLPGEIRNEIYSLLLEVQDADTRAGRGNILFRPTLGLRLRPPKVHTAILATNRTIHTEAADFLYGSNKFHCFLTGGMTGHEFPLESISLFRSTRYFCLISRWAIMLRFRDHREEESRVQLLRHFKTLCEIVAKNSLTRIWIEFMNGSPREGRGGEGQARYIMEVLDQARVLRNVGSASVSDITNDRDEKGQIKEYVSREYLAGLEGVLEGP